MKFSTVILTAASASSALASVTYSKIKADVSDIVSKASILATYSGQIDGTVTNDVLQLGGYQVDLVYALGNTTEDLGKLKKSLTSSQATAVIKSLTKLEKSYDTLGKRLVTLKPSLKKVAFGLGAGYTKLYIGYTQQNTTIFGNALLKKLPSAEKTSLKKVLKVLNSEMTTAYNGFSDIVAPAS